MGKGKAQHQRGKGKGSKQPRNELINEEDNDNEVEEKIEEEEIKPAVSDGEATENESGKEEVIKKSRKVVPVSANKTDDLDELLKNYTESLKVEEKLISVGYGSNFFMYGAGASVIPVYLFITPIFNVPVFTYAPFLLAIIAASGFLLMKANLGVAIKAERDLLKIRNVQSNESTKGGKAKDSKVDKKAQSSKSIGMEAIWWAIFINNALFLIASFMIGLLIVPAVVAFFFEGETTNEDGLVVATTLDSALSESTLEKIWVVGCGVSVIIPSFILSKGVSII